MNGPLSSFLAVHFYLLHFSIHWRKSDTMHFVKILIHLQPVVILSLFIAFILVFGLPAYQKYISYEVYIKETHIEEEALTAPAMTICVEMVRK